MTAAKQPLGDLFRSGQTALWSGIYNAFDDNDGCSNDRVVVLAGEQFPKCPRCGSEARFTLEQQAPHIGEDPDFRE